MSISLDLSNFLTGEQKSSIFDELFEKSFLHHGSSDELPSHSIFEPELLPDPSRQYLNLNNTPVAEQLSFSELPLEAISPTTAVLTSTQPSHTKNFSIYLNHSQTDEILNASVRLEKSSFPISKPKVISNSTLRESPQVQHLKNDFFEKLPNDLSKTESTLQPAIKKLPPKFINTFVPLIPPIEKKNEILAIRSEDEILAPEKLVVTPHDKLPKEVPELLAPFQGSKRKSRKSIHEPIVESKTRLKHEALIELAGRPHEKLSKGSPELSKTFEDSKRKRRKSIEEAVTVKIETGSKCQDPAKLDVSHENYLKENSEFSKPTKDTKRKSWSIEKAISVELGTGSKHQFKINQIITPSAAKSLVKNKRKNAMPIVSLAKPLSEDKKSQTTIALKPHTNFLVEKLEMTKPIVECKFPKINQKIENTEFSILQNNFLNTQISSSYKPSAEEIKTKKCETVLLSEQKKCSNEISKTLLAVKSKRKKPQLFSIFNGCSNPITGPRGIKSGIYRKVSDLAKIHDTKSSFNVFITNSNPTGIIMRMKEFERIFLNSMQNTELGAENEHVSKFAPDSGFYNVEDIKKFQTPVTLHQILIQSQLPQITNTSVNCDNGHRMQSEFTLNSATSQFHKELLEDDQKISEIQKKTSILENDYLIKADKLTSLEEFEHITSTNKYYQGNNESESIKDDFLRQTPVNKLKKNDQNLQSEKSGKLEIRPARTKYNKLMFLANDILKLKDKKYNINWEEKKIELYDDERKKQISYKLITPNELLLNQKFSNLLRLPRKMKKKCKTKIRQQLVTPNQIKPVIRTRYGRILKPTIKLNLDKNDKFVDILQDLKDKDYKLGAQLQKNPLKKKSLKRSIPQSDSQLQIRHQFSNTSEINRCDQLRYQYEAPTVESGNFIWSQQQNRLRPQNSFVKSIEKYRCAVCRKIFIGKRLQKHYISFPDHNLGAKSRSLYELSLYKFLVEKIKSSPDNEDNRTELFLNEISDFVEQLQVRSSKLVRSTSGIHLVNSKTCKVLGIPEGHYSLDVNSIDAVPDPICNEDTTERILAPPPPRLDYNLSISLDDTITAKLNLSDNVIPSEESLLRNVNDLVQTCMEKIVDEKHSEMHYDQSDNAVEAMPIKINQTPILDLSLDLFQFNSN